MRPTTTQRGRAGEAAAVRLLEREGYEILEQNWRFGRLEVDVVAREGSTYVFVEVKARGSSAYGAPEEMVGGDKLARLEEAAYRFLEQRNEPEAAWRVDVVALDVAGDRIAAARLIKGAGL